MTAKAMVPELRKVLKRLHYPREVMMVCSVPLKLSPFGGNESSSFGGVSDR